jgi:hypothetical protein
MKTIAVFSGVMLSAMALSAMAPTAPAQAKGCLKGAIVGGAAGHYAGHHGLIGAAAGCLIGRHEAAKQEREKARQQGDDQAVAPDDR